MLNPGASLQELFLTMPSNPNKHRSFESLIEKSSLDEEINNISGPKNVSQLEKVIGMAKDTLALYNLPNLEEKLEEYNYNRTAGEIWESMIAYSCTDYAEVFAFIQNRLGNPTFMIQMAEKNRHIQSGGEKIPGHVFCLTLVGETLYFCNPTAGKYTPVEDLKLSFTQLIERIMISNKKKDWVVVANGLSGKDMGFKNHKDFLEKMKRVLDETT